VGPAHARVADYDHIVASFKPDRKTRIEGIEVFEKYRT